VQPVNTATLQGTATNATKQNTSMVNDGTTSTAEEGNDPVFAEPPRGIMLQTTQILNLTEQDDSDD
jgi:hypothetical protein